MQPAGEGRASLKRRQYKAFPHLSRVFLHGRILLRTKRFTNPSRPGYSAGMASCRPVQCRASQPGVLLVLLLLAVGALQAACRQEPPVREYTVVGQIVTVQPDPPRVTIRHEDIEGFMPAMTMPFTVREPALLEGKKPGDLVRATLRVQGVEAWIAAIAVTGHAPLPAAPEPGQGATIGDAVPDVALVDAGGEPLRIAGYRGRPLVLTFTYTRCPFAEFCPAIDRRFLELQRAIAADPALSDARLLSISLDPEYDRPPVLRAHAERLGVNRAIWELATGDPDAVLGFGRQFGLDVRRTGDTAADVEHNLRTVVVGRDGRIVSMHTGAGWQARAILDTLRGLPPS